MSVVSKVITPLLISAMSVFGSAASAQDVTLGNFSLEGDDSDVPAGEYCNPVSLRTSIATEFFNLVGCEEGYSTEELLADAPKEPEGFKIPTVEEFNLGNEFAKCFYGSLPGGTFLEDMPEQYIGTGEFMVKEDTLRDLGRAIAFECKGMGLNLS